ncbi:glycerophosphodiester phosphodiesterase [Paenibacillus sp. 32O-W]|uniref:glycerophosphodiester phosphodiesterase family protein n=1 Tax=Paenibacillus sp. 32O-W TaxID=1695218 RepID=UPI0007230088|nr:glycerophosphodiester phosphodiesterase family protein [Paenibacillus sp. 32O-W]ALS29281.1 glycerophosphodiester phosphodiesterase [Paenibacillus sp. 32O-W]
MIERLQDCEAVVVAGHRGYKSNYPENTLLAFEQALKLGVHMLEFDLRLSKDNVIMVIHDETVDRTTDGKGKVGDFSCKELQRLDAGRWFAERFAGLRIPTFEELCELLKAYPDVLLNVEIKPSFNAIEAADGAIAMLKKYGFLERCVFTSFDAAVLAHIHDAYGLKTQGFPQAQMYNFVPGDNGTYSKMWAVGISMKLLTPELVEQFRDMGLQVWCYCPDDLKSVYYALGCGVTLMTCNNPVPALEIGRHRETLRSAKNGRNPLGGATVG